MVLLNRENASVKSDPAIDDDAEPWTAYEVKRTLAAARTFFEFRLGDYAFDPPLGLETQKQLLRSAFNLVWAAYDIPPEDVGARPDIYGNVDYDALAQWLTREEVEHPPEEFLDVVDALKRGPAHLRARLRDEL
jgi:hypothetical protein